MLNIPVAIFQMDVAFGKADQNIKKIEKYAKQIKEEYSLLVLPELCLTGYSKEEIERTAFSSANSMYLDKLSKLCLNYKLMMYGSIAEKDGESYYNTGVFIDQTGLIASYRKIHLFGPMGEKSLFNGGDRIVSMSYNDVSYGLSICYDLRFPYMYQKMVQKGVKVLLVVAEWPITRVNHWSVLLRARAIENQSYVIGVNRVGDDGSYIYGGHSAIISPYGDTLLEFPHADEKLELTYIDLSIVDEFRDKFDVRQDRVPYVDYS